MLCAKELGKAGRNMNRFVARQSLLLLLTAAIWGVAFVAQSVSMDYIGPFTFNMARNLIGGVVLLPCIGLLTKLNEKAGSVDEQGVVEAHVTGEKRVCQKRRTLFAGGVSCGVLLFVASNLQQFGIKYTTVGKAGFITAMYIVLVPILGVFLKKKAGVKVWTAVAVAVLGLYLLCVTDEGFSLQKGDFLVLVCALAFSVHILVIDYFAPKADGVKMSCIQFFVCALLSGICTFLFEEPDIALIGKAWVPVLYAGVLSCGVAYTLQIVGQRGMNPTVASLILSLESVVSVIAGWAILDQSLSRRELFGCVLMFGAIVLVQVPGKRARQIRSSVAAGGNQT